MKKQERLYCQLQSVKESIEHLELLLRNIFLACLALRFNPPTFRRSGKTERYSRQEKINKHVGVNILRATTACGLYKRMFRSTWRLRHHIVMWKYCCNH